MRGKIMFLSGLAVGFVLGARAGREKYEELVVRGRKVLDHPTVQEAAGVAQAQATRLYSEGKEKLSQTKLGEKLSGNGKQGATAENAYAGTPANIGAKTGGTSGSSGGGSSATGSTKSSSSGTPPRAKPGPNSSGTL
jgi:hypothetical protein